jgi:hypothetical protein
MRFLPLLPLFLLLSACPSTPPASAPKCAPETTVADPPAVAKAESNASTASPAAAPKLDIELTQYSFLLGEWEPSSNNANPVEGPFSFTPDVNGRAIIRRLPSSARAGGHDDLLTMYLTQQGDIRALHLNKSGRVIEYAVTLTDNPKEVVFIGKDGPGPGRVRLSYELLADGSMRGRLQTAPDEKAPFRGYLEWNIKKK